ncbi:hypothetical protein GCM10027161_11410 [Microbispora hainanensis]
MLAFANHQPVVLGRQGGIRSEQSVVSVHGSGVRVIFPWCDARDPCDKGRPLRNPSIRTFRHEGDEVAVNDIVPAAGDYFDETLAAASLASSRSG